jgi:phage-related protein
MNPPSAGGPCGSGYRGSPWRIANWSVRDIQKVEFGWPPGMPYCRSLGDGLWEVRSDLTDGRIGRVIFGVARERMVLLHSLVKKTQKTPARDLRLALKRMKEVL